MVSLAFLNHTSQAKILSHVPHISDPRQVLRLGADSGDPLAPLEKVLSSYSLIPQSATSSHLSPPFKGGAVGYVAYDAIYSFERVLRSHRPAQDEIGIPDAVFIVADTVVVFDHLFGSVSVWGHVKVDSLDSLESEYAATVENIRETARKLAQSGLPLPHQPAISNDKVEAVSNVGKAGYEGFVTKLRDEHIVNGDIIQAVPSQRLSRRTDLHPFNAYRYLRQINPSPYMFYINCALSDASGSSNTTGPASSTSSSALQNAANGHDKSEEQASSNSLQIVGASPECLLSVSPERIVTNHAIAGTIKRGATPAEDNALAETLKASIKDRAEHVMLVDLARNDINRVCRPETVRVAELMEVTRFSHVMHLTSTVEGELRQGLNRFDAFRSIFPAGTVSGAPKIKAMELIASMEPSLRGVYAGAVGRWNLGKGTDECDTCIAIRTMVFKNGTVYLQAGGGIVWDSNEEEEYVETVNKLAANVRTLEKAEDFYRDHA